MPRTRRRVPFAPAVLCLAAVATTTGGLAAQVAWQTARVLTRTADALTAFDSARERLLVLDAGAMRLWEADGVRWIERGAPVAPPPRLGAAMVHDAARGRLVVFGGSATAGAAPNAETWEWDGSTWTLRTPATSPPARAMHELAYDAARQRVVLFGGASQPFGGNPLADTWEWDGTNWLQRSSTAVPPARRSFGMTFDSARQRVVMFGGQGQTPTTLINLGDTWEWDGTNWLARPQGPLGRFGHLMAYDTVRQRTVLFGGGWNSTSGSHTFYTPLTDTWEWDGVAWVQRTPAGPVPQQGIALDFDPNRQHAVLFDRDPNNAGPARQWEWDGTTWHARPVTPSIGQRMAFDSARGRTVMLHEDLTWEWDGATWAVVPATASPPPRDLHATAFDTASQRVVVFGGRGPGQAPLGDTWTWDGATWTQHTGPGPSPRQQHAMAHDPLRQRTVLFGGSDGAIVGGLLGDTWEWDGQAWTQLAPPVSPLAVADHGMAWDPTTQSVLLINVIGQTWTWNGTTWTQRQALPPSPPIIGRAEVAHDASRNRVVLMRGVFDNSTWWDWNGAQWTPFTSPTAAGGPIAGDVLGRVVSIDRILTGVPRATAVDAGSGCAGATAAPRLASSAPYFGNAAFAFEVLDAPASAACIVGLAFGTTSSPLGAGCTLLIDAPFALAVAAANPSGFARTAPVAIPVVAVLAGAQLHAQALVLDPLAPLGFGLTARRTSTLGP